MEDLRQTKEWSRWLSSTGWVVETLRTGKKESPVFVRKIPLVPISFLKVQRYEGMVDWKGGFLEATVLCRSDHSTDRRKAVGGRPA